MSYVYGIPPDVLSHDYSLEDVVALSDAASRFLTSQSEVKKNYTKYAAKQKPVRQNTSNGPDLAGFREIYGKNFKKKLE